MLTADAYGVLPPIARLTPDGAMYHFLSGYTARVAGTEKGVTEPKATFSTCFGAPFLPLNPNVYASMLGKKIARHDARVWLVNTGWTGGPYGVGRRMSIAYTRGMITAALTGQLDAVAYQRHPVFNVDTPTTCPGVPDAVLDPRGTWQDAAKYDAQAHALARMFVENFKAFEGDVASRGERLGSDGLTGRHESQARRLATSMLVLKLAEEILSADEVVVEDPPRGAQEFRNQRIAHGVPHADALLAPRDDVVGAQHRELLGHDRLLHAESVLQLLHVHLFLHQEFEHSNSDGMRERFEERRLERLKLLGGDISHRHMCILHSLHVRSAGV